MEEKKPYRCIINEQKSCKLSYRKKNYPSASVGKMDGLGVENQ